jgi:hypothetical protein
VLWRTLALTGARSCQAQRPWDAWCLSTTSPKPAFQQTDEYQRVKFEFVNVKPFACLAFPLSRLRENTVKQPDFGDELVTGIGDPGGYCEHRCCRLEMELPKGQ